MNLYLAQKLEISGTTIEGPLKGISSLSDVVSLVLQFLYPLAGLILFFVLVWGGYGYMTSGGVPEKVDGARGKITSGLIGFFLLVLSYFLVRFISFIFGLGEGIF
ncbi:hypothetical protein A3F34_02860 [Candidatus Roizmanbacteria bacterium RIFCSPHIGHO2_12_FULL_44_10]|uniref:Uncharacterized protein n=1 Tax=Candidatus Roizmanbacteria bacterium RIFCSPHIGHO2_12_FULL_44_10 TaxID=1802054 RepID=A0A1F7I6H0_9BACT|nr:MAG: hypothetical protein A3F34_02860 [Candidatus Roizmanbacteria bacterium RIFCSPHIGHO2_12_FULL_44_10]